MSMRFHLKSKTPPPARPSTVGEGPGRARTPLTDPRGECHCVTQLKEYESVKHVIEAEEQTRSRNRALFKMLSAAKKEKVELLGKVTSMARVIESADSGKRIRVEEELKKKVMELDAATDAINSMDTSLRRSNVKLRASEQRNTNLSKEIDEKNASIELLQDQLGEANQLISALQSRVLELTDANNNIRGEWRSMMGAKLEATRLKKLLDERTTELSGLYTKLGVANVMYAFRGLLLKKREEELKHVTIKGAELPAVKDRLKKELKGGDFMTHLENVANSRERAAIAQEAATKIKQEEFEDLQKRTKVAESENMELHSAVDGLKLDNSELKQKVSDLQVANNKLMKESVEALNRFEKQYQEAMSSEVKSELDRLKKKHDEELAKVQSKVEAAQKELHSFKRMHRDATKIVEEKAALAQTWEQKYNKVTAERLSPAVVNKLLEGLKAEVQQREILIHQLRANSQRNHKLHLRGMAALETKTELQDHVRFQEIQLELLRSEGQALYIENWEKTEQLRAIIKHYEQEDLPDLLTRHSEDPFVVWASLRRRDIVKLQAERARMMQAALEHAKTLNTEPIFNTSAIEKEIADLLDITSVVKDSLPQQAENAISDKPRSGVPKERAGRDESTPASATPILDDTTGEARLEPTAQGEADAGAGATGDAGASHSPEGPPTGSEPAVHQKHLTKFNDGFLTEDEIRQRMSLITQGLFWHSGYQVDEGLQAQLVRARERAGYLSRKLADATALLASAEKRRARAEKLAKSEQGKLGNLQIQVTQLSQNLRAREDQIEVIRGHLKYKYRTLVTQQRAQKVSIQSLRDTTSRQEKEVQALRGDLDLTKFCLSETTAKLSVLEEETGRDRVLNSMQKSERYQTLMELRKDNRAMKAELSALRTRLEHAESERSAAKAEAEEATTTLSHLTAFCNTLRKSSGIDSQNAAPPPSATSTAPCTTTTPTASTDTPSHHKNDLSGSTPSILPTVAPTPEASNQGSPGVHDASAAAAPGPAESPEGSSRALSAEFVKAKAMADGMPDPQAAEAVGVDTEMWGFLPFPVAYARAIQLCKSMIGQVLDSEDESERALAKMKAADERLQRLHDALRGVIQRGVGDGLLEATPELPDFASSEAIAATSEALAAGLRDALVKLRASQLRAHVADRLSEVKSSGEAEDPPPALKPIRFIWSAPPTARGGLVSEAEEGTAESELAAGDRFAPEVQRRGSAEVEEPEASLHSEGPSSVLPSARESVDEDFEAYYDRADMSRHRRVFFVLGDPDEYDYLTESDDDDVSHTNGRTSRGIPVSDRSSCGRDVSPRSSQGSFDGDVGEAESDICDAPVRVSAEAQSLGEEPPMAAGPGESHGESPAMVDDEPSPTKLPDDANEPGVSKPASADGDEVSGAKQIVDSAAETPDTGSDSRILSPEIPNDSESVSDVANDATNDSAATAMDAESEAASAGKSVEAEPGAADAASMASGASGEDPELRSVSPRDDELHTSPPSASSGQGTPKTLHSKGDNEPNLEASARSHRSRRRLRIPKNRQIPAHGTAADDGLWVIVIPRNAPTTLAARKGAAMLSRESEYEHVCVENGVQTDDVLLLDRATSACGVRDVMSASGSVVSEAAPKSARREEPGFTLSARSGSAHQSVISSDDAGLPESPQRPGSMPSFVAASEGPPDSETAAPSAAPTESVEGPVSVPCNPHRADTTTSMVSGRALDNENDDSNMLDPRNVAGTPDSRVALQSRGGARSREGLYSRDGLSREGQGFSWASGLLEQSMESSGISAPRPAMISKGIQTPIRGLLGCDDSTAVEVLAGPLRPLGDSTEAAAGSALATAVPIQSQNPASERDSSARSYSTEAATMMYAHGAWWYGGVADEDEDETTPRPDMVVSTSKVDVENAPTDTGQTQSVATEEENGGATNASTTEIVSGESSEDTGDMTKEAVGEPGDEAGPDGRVLTAQSQSQRLGTGLTTTSFDTAGGTPATPGFVEGGIPKTSHTDGQWPPVVDGGGGCSGGEGEGEGSDSRGVTARSFLQEVWDGSVHGGLEDDAISLSPGGLLGIAETEALPSATAPDAKGNGWLKTEDEALQALGQHVTRLRSELDTQGSNKSGADSGDLMDENLRLIEQLLWAKQQLSAHGIRWNEVHSPLSTARSFGSGLSGRRRRPKTPSALRPTSADATASNVSFGSGSVPPGLWFMGGSGSHSPTDVRPRLPERLSGGLSGNLPPMPDSIRRPKSAGNLAVGSGLIRVGRPLSGSAVRSTSRPSSSRSLSRGGPLRRISAPSTGRELGRMQVLAPLELPAKQETALHEPEGFVSPIGPTSSPHSTIEHPSSELGSPISAVAAQPRDSTRLTSPLPELGSR
eukprot:Rmarinus@m.25359